MRIRKAKLLPRDKVGWISRNRLDSGRCLSLFLDIPFYRTQNQLRQHPSDFTHLAGYSVLSRIPGNRAD
jgi:hypothetical protein